MTTYASVADLPSCALSSQGDPLIDLYASTGTLDAPAPTTNTITGMKIFRVGSFKNSAGEKATWTVADLKAMVTNFHELRGKGLFPHVPVRENHGRDVRDIVGYFTDLRVEDKFLVADLELTEPQALSRYTNGTYRARSLELGAYETNDGELYYPTVMGLAFCDIPAVEGLYAAAVATYDKSTVRAFGAPPAPGPGRPKGSKDGPNSSRQPGSNEAKAAGSAANANGDTPTEPPFDNPAEALKDVLLDLHELKDLLAGDPDSEATLQRIVDAVTAFNDDLQNPGDASDDAKSGANATTGGSGPANHTANGPDGASSEVVVPDLIKFSLGGTEIEAAEAAKPVLESFSAQFAALTTERDNALAENTALKTAAQEQAYALRDAAVDAWLTAKKITPAEVEGQKAFCRTLSDEQFTAHKTMKENAPALSFTAAPATGEPGTPPEGDDKAAKIANYNKTLSMMKMAGVQGDAYTNSKPYKALVALGVTPEGE